MSTEDRVLAFEVQATDKIYVSSRSVVLALNYLYND